MTLEARAAVRGNTRCREGAWRRGEEIEGNQKSMFLRESGGPAHLALMLKCLAVLGGAGSTQHINNGWLNAESAHSCSWRTDRMVGVRVQSMRWTHRFIRTQKKHAHICT